MTTGRSLDRRRGAPGVCAAALVAVSALAGACSGGGASPADDGNAMTQSRDGAPDGAATPDSGSRGSDGQPESGAVGPGPGDAAGDVADSGGDGGAGAGPPFVCPQGYSWTPWREWIADAIADFGGVTPDELTVAWTRTSGDVATADRENAHG